MPSALSIFGAVWSNQWTRLAAVAAICFATGWAKAWMSFPRVDVAAIRRDASAARDLVWQTRFEEQQRQAQAAIDAAIAAGMSEPAVPADRSERMRDCQRSPTCRDRRK